MSWLSEDPWPLAGALGLLALGFLIALRVTQQGKHLIRAAVALGLALAVVAIEQVWVTDRERIEAVVYDLGRAVENSDAEAVLEHMAPDVTLSQNDVTIGGPQAAALGQMVPGMSPGATNPARAVIRGTVRTARFDFVRITHIEAHAGRETRRGQAEIRVYAAGSFGALNFATPTNGTDWSLGFREEDGRWMVESITATRLPRGFQIPLQSAPGP